ncbi:GIY-YIG nuclease family protein [Flavivirga jejuensis]|uniref:GIY-YIG nuclease family protein n=1 Tax=Flavivirga jejuensis TaxID=870487 RepID=A0ABT8WUE4_9FLAO|nr:GIY-YIG nuclease family protein [Flavivirga jejuensis]MDO5976803.1 GIY-YIG nuclease family protein [Flavivirga jejuensis]
MRNYYVYILKCNDDLTYTGGTNNLSKRFNEHQRELNKECRNATHLKYNLKTK